jgi:hypothetical protein
VVPELRRLSAAWLDELVRRMVYSRDEMDALELPTDQGRECSWAAPPELQAGPLTLIATAKHQVVAGVELWQQLRDRYWFLEGLVRNQAPAYKGVGREVATAAMAYLFDVIEGSGGRYGMRVHAMSREVGAVKFWTDLMNRKPDFEDAFMKTPDYLFPAVGWIIVPTPMLIAGGARQLVSAEPPWVMRCRDCQTVLARGNGPTPQTEPCSNCGSTDRLIEKGLEGGLSFDSRFIGHQQKEGGNPIGEAVRIAGPGKREASGDVVSEVLATQDISGAAPHGEEGALETATLVVEKLRELGEEWSQPSEVGDKDVDCRATGPSGSLDIQVVRAAASDTWKTLNRDRGAEQVTSPNDLADALLAVAEKKAARLPAAQRRNLVLAIDARDTPAFAMAGIADSFRQRHLDEAAHLGFRAMWVVGPTVELVVRLDR